jgi:dethiobiotin synthetase
MAAAVLGRPAFGLAALRDELRWPDGIEVGLVETAGGVRSPLASDDADAVALSGSLRPDVVVLVADAGLGTINAVRVSVGALEDVLAARDDLHLTVALNRFDADDDLHRRNLAWLRDRDALDVVTTIGDVADRLLAAPASADQSG